MAAPNRLPWLALATTLLFMPNQAEAAGRHYAALTREPPQKQPRRRVTRVPQSIAPVMSPCGRHVAQVVRGVVLVNGRRVHPDGGMVYLLTPPKWRRDGRAVAWIERAAGETRLMVLTDVSDREALPWALPSVSPTDQVFWAAATRVVVGPALLAPRAVASWTESVR